MTSAGQCAILSSEILNCDKKQSHQWELVAFEEGIYVEKDKKELTFREKEDRITRWIAILAIVNSILAILVSVLKLLLQ